MSELTKPDQLHDFDAALSAFCARVQASFDELGREAQQARELVDSLGARLESLQQESKGSQDALRDRLKALAAWMAEERSGDARAEERLAALEQDRDAQQQAAAAERDRAEELTRRLATADDGASMLRENVATLEEDLAEARAELARARDALEAAPNAEALAAERDRIAAELQDARNAVAGALSADKAAELRDALERQTRELEEARRALEQSVSATELQELRESFKAEQTRALELEERLRQEAARNKQSVLAEQLAEALKENEALREELARRDQADGAALNGSVAAGPAKPASRRLDQLETERLRQVAGNLRDGHKRSIGEILIDAELITPEQLEEALDEQRRNPHTHLGALLARKGFTSSEAVAQALALQCGVPFIQLDDMAVDAAVAPLISGRLARQHQCVPLRMQDNDTLVVALGNPLDLVAIEDIERATNHRVEVVVAMEEDILQVIEANYPAE